MSVVEKYAVFCDGDAPWRGAQKPYVRRNYIAELNKDVHLAANG